MEVRFAVYQNDAMGAFAAEYLANKGYEVLVLASDETVTNKYIALFTAGEGAHIHKRYVSVCPYKFAERNITPPEWASNTPFQVAIRADANRRRMYEFGQALDQIADTYAAWNAWESPQAPWNPSWRHGSTPAGFVEWQANARLAQTPRSKDTRIRTHLPPVFPALVPQENTTLVVIGCAAFNRAHTDLVDVLKPEKMHSVVNNLVEIVEGGNFSNVSVIIPEADVLDYESVRTHLHPFMFMSVKEIEAMLAEPFTEETRLWERRHRRTDAEIAESFTASAEAMHSQLVYPLAKRVTIPVTPVSWMGLLEPYLGHATGLAEANRDLLSSIYMERVRTRPSYAVMHALDAEAGMRRTEGNAVLYIAEAMYLRDHPECVLANHEVNEVYWLGLERILRPIWGTRTPYIGMVHERYRQPWGY